MLFLYQTNKIKTSLGVNIFLSFEQLLDQQQFLRIQTHSWKGFKNVQRHEKRVKAHRSRFEANKIVYYNNKKLSKWSTPISDSINSQMNFRNFPKGIESDTLELWYFLRFLISKVINFKFMIGTKIELSIFGLNIDLLYKSSLEWNRCLIKFPKSSYNPAMMSTKYLFE